VRLLTIKIKEPLLGQVLPEMVISEGATEASRRYRAIVLTSLRQLRGLTEARLRIEVSPGDADEAIRFWLLPKLAASWRAEQSVFYSPGWEIDFGGDASAFSIHASCEILCPNLGARWIHTALLGLGSSVDHVVGPASDGSEYFRAHAPGAAQLGETRILPLLPVIRTSDDWNEALNGFLGPALKRAWEEEA
jgi:hypothetical protein